MSPALDERTDPDTASGAVSFHPRHHRHPGAGPADAPLLSERDFWLAVRATLLATLRSWSR
jgi:hypothetical protein